MNNTLTRQQSRNRICFNLGNEKRFFLFINLGIDEIVSKIKAEHNATIDEVICMDDIVTLFLELYPEYPVLKLKVEPGEGYLAPTEYIIHDGYNAGNKEMDIRLTLRGYFSQLF
jgi:hypothetical protein